MRRTLNLLATAAVATALAASQAAAENPGRRKPAGDSAQTPSKADERADVNNPIVQLALDPAVHEELGLSELQLAALGAAYRKIEPALWRLRDVSAGQHAAEKASLLASMERELDSLLPAPQRARLGQLVVRARGWPGITVEPAAARLALSADQLASIQQIIADTAQQIGQIAQSDKSPAARNEAVTSLRTAEGTAIQKLLSPQQRQTLAKIVGSPYDLSSIRPLSFQAPQLKPVEAWINTEPLSMSHLRGKVVAFHFWASGCINCVRNLPHYAGWHDRFAPQGLVVLGMHTPETAAERSLDNLRAKVDEYAIRYPVAMDREAGNWAAWANSMWPSVYLVDKRGRVRYWWYGEMNWQGTEGEKFMRQKITELLAE